MWYSPFTDKKGNMKSIDKVVFKDILQLETKEIQEGYNIEYKSKWDENFKNKHLCQVIVSLANAGGGWFFIGVEDGTGKYIGIDKERSDFSQTISIKLASNVSPLPIFDCKFLHEPENKSKGVLIIYVYEGINPPYVCKGMVYTRCGSSKIPIPSERSAIDGMISRKEYYDKEIKKFCVNHYINGLKNHPYMTLYFYNPYALVEKNYNWEKLDAIKKFFGESSTVKYQESFNSVIRVNSAEVSAYSLSAIEEYFTNGCIKIYMPMFLLNESSVASWICEVKQCNSNIDLHDMRIVEGVYTYMILLKMVSDAILYIQKYEHNLSEYKIAVEYNNTNGLVFYNRHKFDNQESIDIFREGLKQGKVHVCYISEMMTEPVSFLKKRCKDDAMTLATDLLYSKFLPLFGIDPKQFSEILDYSNGKYNESSFSTKNYQE